MDNETGRNLPLFLLVQALLGIPLKKYFPKYNADYLYSRLGGYLKAFREYYTYRIVHVLGEMKKILVAGDKRQHQRRVTQDKSLEISVLTEYFLVFLKVMMDQTAIFIPFFYKDETGHNTLIHRRILKEFKGNKDVYVDVFRSFAQIIYAFQSVNHYISLQNNHIP